MSHPLISKPQPNWSFIFTPPKVASVDDRPPNHRNKRAAHPAVLFAAPDHKQREKFPIKNGLLTERVRKPF